MPSLEETFEQACASREIPHAAIIATNKTGSFHYEKVFGPRSVRDGADQSPLKLDDIMWIASCTKLMTAIATMQCVERAQLELDKPVYDILPELKDLDIIEGLDNEGKPLLKKHKTPITLRLLLTHASGLTYDEIHPLTMAWRHSQGQGASKAGTVEERFGCPLVFEPGTQWMYGSGLDWAGKMVERVNGDITLQAYMERHLWAPLGIKDMSFHLSTRPDLEKRKTDMSKRDETTGKVRQTDSRMPYEGATDCMGGQGVFACAPEFVKLLQSILADDEKLLKKATVDVMFEPQLGDGSRAALLELLRDDTTNNAMGGMPPGTRRDWGLGGLLILDDMPEWRRSGTMTWCGLPNLTWWIDRKTGLCGMYAGQLLPTGDAKVVRMTQIFEKEMYKAYLGQEGKVGKL